MGQYTQSEGKKSWRAQYRPYLVAISLAIVMTILIAPEVNEGDAMSPTLKDGQVVVITKKSYSAKRGAPKRGQVVALEKTAAKEVTDDNLIARVSGLPGDLVEVDGKQVKLNKHQVFLLCDNEKSNLDSRNKALGPVDMKLIKGNVKFVVWPVTAIGGVE